MPALQRADAREFSGLIELGGTIDAPRLSGEVTIRDGRFRLAPNTLPFDVGMQEVSGRLLIVDGNRLVIDPANSLQGRIVPAGSISAPETGNRPNSNRLPVPPGGVAPRVTATAPANAPSTASPDATSRPRRLSRRRACRSCR
jgi:autotransporter translocation and assembly factor TamB